MKLTVLGAGSWGLTLAWLYANAGLTEVTLWDRKPEKLAQLKANPHCQLPVNIALPASIQFQPNLQTAVAQADVLLLAVSSSGTREVAERLQGCIPPHTVVINVSKGIEHPSLNRLSCTLQSLLPAHTVAVLSGPTLAQELLNNLPTACVLACTDYAVCERLQPVLSVGQLFRVYSNTDVIGVELGGALKNIFAIASGYMATRGLGDNARAALITRGLHEMTQFALSQGAEEATLYGLSGLGDLLATCNSPLSRNYQVGVGLANNMSLSDILAQLGAVAEGVKTTLAVSQLAKQQDMDMPITQLIAQALQGKLSQDDFIQHLMSRRLRSEG
jgi:glycerol-3-phosphate dehydrogenase (NAD(P)+)